MKKLLFIFVAFTLFLASSCSEERKINRRLDGSWKATTYKGVVVPSDESELFNFSKDKKDDGTGISTITNSGITLTLSFNYTISGNKLTLVTSFFGLLDSQEYTINTIDKELIEWTDGDGLKTILVPN